MIFIIITIIIFSISIIISQFITDPNLRIAFWLMLFLIYISYVNIHLSTYFYTKLREQPGLQGPRGNFGERGPQGSNGTCIVTEECGVVSDQYNELFQDEIKKQNESYRNIMTKVKNGIILDDDEKQIKNMIEDFIAKVKTKAEEEKWPLSKVKEEITNTFTD